MEFMTLETIAGWDNEFKLVWENAGKVFRRHDLRKRAEGYIKALFGMVGRKNSWQIAEYLGNNTPHAMQRLLGRASWNADDLRDEIMRYAVDNMLGKNENGVLIIDETGFLKKGEKSAGVQRQYSGTAGRIENCQVGVFLALAGTGGRALIDRELYLPKKWCEDGQRCKDASIPQDIKFETRQQLAQKMLSRAFDNNVSPKWVLGDAVYGSDSKFRRFLESHNQPYVLAVSSQQRLWMGMQQKRFDAIAKEIPDYEWFRMSAADGTKGPRIYDWAAGKFGGPTESGMVRWALFRRSIESPDDLAYYLCLAPVDATANDLAIASGQRWNIECCFETAKQATGLDEYEVRSWRGWYRHITLSMFALCFLAVVGHRSKMSSVSKKRCLRWCR